MDHGAHPWPPQSWGRPTRRTDTWRSMYHEAPPYYYMNNGNRHIQKPHPKDGYQPWPPDSWSDYYSQYQTSYHRHRDWGRPASRAEISDRSDTYPSRPLSRQEYDERYTFYEASHRHRNYYSDHQAAPTEYRDWRRRPQSRQTEQWVVNSYNGPPLHQTAEGGRAPPQTQSWTQGYEENENEVDKLQLLSLAEPSLLSQYRDSGMSSSSYELSQYMNDPSDTSDSWSHIQEVSSEQAFHHLAPLKFSLPHVTVCFGARGQLVRVCPNFPTEGQPARVEIHSIEVLLHDTLEQEEMRNFPGPVQREDLHKVDIIKFCQQKVSECLHSKVPRSGDDSLLWQMLLQMCRQNGCIAGSDVAELLLQDCKRDPYRRALSSANLINLSEEPPLIPDCAQMDLLTGEIPSPAETSAQAVEKFTKLLFYGRKKEALDWAMRSELWGHALFLSSKMDSRTHSWVMGRFTSTLAQNDPLQTLFQLMAGRIPQAAMCCGDTKWGDWRPHLAAILSNQMADSELNRRAVITMGDNLVLKGLTEAGHCCYLTADIPFGQYYGKSDRLVLLGSSHSQRFPKFASSQSIQRTEIMEYCQSLGKPGHCIPAFQVYKLLYATRLLDYGLTSLALHYCECIAAAVLSHSGSATLISQLIKLAERLKFSDPSILDRCEEEPKWMTQLRTLLGRLQASSDAGRQTPVPVNEPIKASGFTAPITVTEGHAAQAFSGVEETQDVDDTAGHCATWTPENQSMQAMITPSREDTEHNTRQLAAVNEYTSCFNAQEPTHIPDIPVKEPPPQTSLITAGVLPQPPFASGRVRTVSETSTVSMDDEEEEDGGEKETSDDKSYEAKKGSSFGWFGWFRSKPAKNAEPPKSTDTTHQELIPPMQANAASETLSYSSSPPPAYPRANTQINPFSKNAGGKEIEEPQNNNSSSVLPDTQGQQENMVRQPNSAMLVPGDQTGRPGGAVPMYNPSQFSGTGHVMNKPSRLQGRYPVQP
ncbi:protein transport protein Sec16B isoform X2 [Spea bombifrons]|uniref:protein transport protein Sec16B isoform X2 n=1 Tax=Spea bombifrons TaxID=233779 RepID=UPI002349D4D3|nr:protein transport protein Sec16B isoform X2 [Spea bombifrons]